MNLRFKKNGIALDNRHAVPHNPKLLMRYQAHINMEWCNQSSSIKYLFKYINKGYDRITAAVVYENPTIQSAQNNEDKSKSTLIVDMSPLATTITICQPSVIDYATSNRDVFSLLSAFVSSNKCNSCFSHILFNYFSLFLTHFCLPLCYI
jgi:hypothetical protein